MRSLLIEYRGERSQEEMARTYGVTQQLWSLWERGSSCPSPAIMLQLEKDTGIAMEQLFFDVFNKNNLLVENQNHQAV